MEMSLKEAVSRAIDECISEGVLSEFFKEYKNMIIESDVLDYTFEARLRMHDEAHKEDIRKYEELVADQAEALAKKDEALANQAEALSDRDKTIESLLKEIESLKSSKPGR